MKNTRQAYTEHKTLKTAHGLKHRRLKGTKHRRNLHTRGKLTDTRKPLKSLKDGGNRCILQPYALTLKLPPQNLVRFGDTQCSQPESRKQPQVQYLANLV